MNYFGKSKQAYRNVYHPAIDDAAVYYKQSIVDDEVLVLSSDGSSYQMSDIRLLKGLNANSSQALAESLSVRMQVRESSGVHEGLKDSDIKRAMRPRYTQDKTELEAYSGLVMSEVHENLVSEDYDALPSEIAENGIETSKEE